MNRTSLGLLMAATAAGLLIACSGAAKPAATATPAAATAVATTPAPTPTATPSPTAAPAVSAVTIKALEDGEKYSYSPSTATLKAGEVTITLVNNGVKWPHTLAIKSLTAGAADLLKSDRIPLTKEAALKVTLSEPGTYKIYCTVQGHEDKGMVGTLTVVKG